MLFTKGVPSDDNDNNINFGTSVVEVASSGYERVPINKRKTMVGQGENHTFSEIPS